MEKFRALGIAEPVLKVLKKEQFEEPTEIQEKSIPYILKGKDVIAGAATGSGKTFAFSMGIINNVVHGKGIQALVLTPTRELAEQVCQALIKFSKNKKMNIMPVYGGVSINPQIQKLPRADVVIGTPGRVLDHIARGTIDLSHVNTLVLDEADRMLDMGFIKDVEDIVRKCPKERQTLFFSATISREIARLSDRYLTKPVEVSAESYVDPKKLKQTYYDVESNRKFSLLVNLLQEEREGLVMVFCNTRRNTDFVVNNLKANGIDANALHGGFSQAKRSKTLGRFNKGNVSVLVCTDVAARGLDIKGVSHVYNYDLPNDAKDYIHRIGRTARAGEEGNAINILSQRDHDNFTRILQSYDVDIRKQTLPKIQRAKIVWMGDARRGRGGRRGFSGRVRGGGSRGSSRGGGRGGSRGGSRGSSRGGSSDRMGSESSRGGRREEVGGFTPFRGRGSGKRHPR